MQHNPIRKTQTLSDVSVVPQTRQELEAAIAKAPASHATGLTRQWLSLDGEYSKLSEQLDHINSTFPDELLSALLEAQIASLRQALHRRAEELADIPAAHIVETCCKCFLRARLIAIAPDDALTSDQLLRSIRSDLDFFGLDGENASTLCA
ncbi:MAG: hypothetical protein WA989_14365 [Henriciella sp.]|uniref:hypothetical protein n=1 Tax=Henriciella sp. TaxID=1968823 RepID=UPI003C71ADED